MRIAVVALTKEGSKTAEKAAAVLKERGQHETVLYLPGKFSLLRIEGERQPYRKPLRLLFPELFNSYEGIVCVMALGIAVRMLGPVMQDKTKDPAVVVMDELGRHVISVLSGHWGGANDLAAELAEQMGANPVITTATDVHGLPCLENIARDHGFVIEPKSGVKKINAAIVNGSKILIYSELPLNIEPCEQIEVLDFAQYAPARQYSNQVVLVTNRVSSVFPPGTMFLRPRNLCVGVGCRRGAGAEEIRAAVEQVLAEAGRAMGAVRSLASVDIKSDEPGLLQAAEEMELPLEFFSRQHLEKCLKERSGELMFSDLVHEKIGVGGVCEPAAILGAGETAQLILPKTKYKKVTAAIAEADLP